VSRYSVDAVSALLKPSTAVSAASPQAGMKKLLFQLVGGEGFDEPPVSDRAPAKSGIRFEVTVPAGPIGLLLQERDGSGDSAGRVFVARVRKQMLQHLVPVGAAVVAVDGIDTSSGSLDWCSELVAHAADRPRRLTLEVPRGVLLPGGVAGASRHGVKCPSEAEAIAAGAPSPARSIGSPSSAAAPAPEAAAAPSPRVAIQNVENKEVVLKVPVSVGLGLVLEEQQQAPRIYIARFDDLEVKGPDGAQLIKKNPLVGVVPVGAYLVQINDELTTRCSLQEVTAIIKQSGTEGPRRVLKFRF